MQESQTDYLGRNSDSRTARQELMLRKVLRIMRKDGQIPASFVKDSAGMPRPRVKPRHNPETYQPKGGKLSRKLLRRRLRKARKEYRRLLKAKRRADRAWKLPLLSR